MKKTILMSALLFSGVATATLVAAPNEISTVTIEMNQDEKVKIEADALPTPVKATITGDETVSSFPIIEAWQIAKPEGKFHYKVVFDNGEEEKITKKYDEEGNEIKE